MLLKGLQYFRLVIKIFLGYSTSVAGLNFSLEHELRFRRELRLLCRGVVMGVAEEARRQATFRCLLTYSLQRLASRFSMKPAT